MLKMTGTQYVLNIQLYKCISWLLWCLIITASKVVIKRRLHCWGLVWKTCSMFGTIQCDCNRSATIWKVMSSKRSIHYQEKFLRCKERKFTAHREWNTSKIWQKMFLEKKDVYDQIFHSFWTGFNYNYLEGLSTVLMRILPFSQNLKYASLEMWWN